MNAFKKRYYKRNKIWILNFEGLLKHNNRLFVLRDKALREKLINKYYNNSLIKHFNAIKTYKLLTRKYY